MNQYWKSVRDNPNMRYIVHGYDLDTYEFSCYFISIVRAAKKYMELQAKGCIVSFSALRDEDFRMERHFFACVDKLIKRKREEEIMRLRLETLNNQPKVQVPEVVMSALLEQLNSLMRLMGFGREYVKCVHIARDLQLMGVDMDKYPDIKVALRRI